MWVRLYPKVGSYLHGGEAFMGVAQVGILSKLGYLSTP